MFFYHMRMAIKSIRRNIVLSALMVAAIGIGIGVCMTAITVFYMMSSDPIPYKSDSLYAVQLNSWEAPGPYDADRPERLPELLTYRDAKALLDSEVPTRSVATYRSGFTLNPDNPDVSPMLVMSRFTTRNFFSMFDVPFLYGAPWDEATDRSGDSIAVLNYSINEEVFGGENSVGRTVELAGREFTVVGVMDRWEPVPKFYAVFNGAFEEAEEVFMPMLLNESWERQNYGNTNCWGDTPMNGFRDFLDSECTWVEFWVELNDAEQKSRYQDWLAGYIAEQKRLGRFPIENAGAEVHDVNEWMDYNEVVSADFRVLVGLAFMFLAVCLLNTVALLLAKFSGNAARVGLRRALGASKAMIFRQNLVEVGVIGIAGSLLGLGLAWLGLQGVRSINLGHYDRLVQMDANLVLFAVAISLLSAIIAGLYPTWRICQIPPATHLKTQ
ncbi:MAG: ABC transporter permease [Gammaproteobacteria bacterium]|nr:ABC transporter permease [Gammaproteobacteria bacterium]